MVQAAEHRFVGCAVGHDVVQAAGAEHEHHGDEINRDSPGTGRAPHQVRPDGVVGKGEEQGKHHDAVTDGSRSISPMSRAKLSEQ